MKVIFHPEAVAEFDQAINWYEEKQLGLGRDFAAEVRGAIDRALLFPIGCTEIAPGVRRALTRRFPYGVLYVLDGEALQIVAVMHLSQRPGYWQQRH